MLHAAMFEAVNSIDPQFRPYRACHRRAEGRLRRTAAASAAAYRAARCHVLPAQEAALGEERHQVLTAGIPGGPGKGRGDRRRIEQSPQLLLYVQTMARTSRLPTRNYPVLENTCSRQPTRWLRHRLARCAPFILGKFDQFRPPPPPALDSPQYLRDLAEVKLLGEKESATRTKVQTEIAFYTRPLPGYIAWNIIARHAVQAKALDIEISESNGTPKFCDNGRCRLLSGTRNSITILGVL